MAKAKQPPRFFRRCSPITNRFNTNALRLPCRTRYLSRWLFPYCLPYKWMALGRVFTFGLSCLKFPPEPRSVHTSALAYYASRLLLEPRSRTSARIHIPLSRYVGGLSNRSRLKPSPISNKNVTLVVTSHGALHPEDYEVRGWASGVFGFSSCCFSAFFAQGCFVRKLSVGGRCVLVACRILIRVLLSLVRGDETI